MFLFKKGDVRVFKMATGEEMIATVAEVENEVLTVTDPLILAMSKNGATLMPATFLGDTSNPVYLNRNAIILHAQPQLDVFKSYKEQISGLTLVTAEQPKPKSIIMG